MITFKEYLLESDQIKDFQTYINRIPMLKYGIEILKKLEKYGEAYIVGGTIRDIISGEKDPDDIDIATNVSLEKVEELFNTHDIGSNKDFGIVVVDYKGFTYEVANFRSDGTYSDGRRPDSIKIELSYKKDAERRDFSINALAIDSKGNIIDYFDGTKDIKNKILKSVGDPKKRFEEDYLRMLRLPRFASRLGFSIDDNTFNAAKKLSKNITKVAPERIMKELMKMLNQPGDKVAESFILLDKMNLLQYILPELVKTKNFKHNISDHPEGSYVRKIISE